MYHPPPKRKQLIQRIAVYVLMSISVVGLVTALVLIMLGYQFNRNDGKIEQGGLVQFDSHPGGVNVAIDGASFGTRTPSKTTMTSGDHFITMNRDGYRQWQKSVNVVAGSVLWLNYTRMIPNDLAPANVASFATLGGTLSSPDDKWMAIQEAPAAPVIKLADLSADEVKTSSLTLPSDSYTQPSAGQSQSFSLVNWDNDSHYLLVNHVYDGAKQEWLAVDTTDVSNTKNITKLFNVTASKLVFSATNNQVMYAQIGTEVHRLDLSSTVLSAPLLTNIAEFSSFDQKIGYVTLPDATTKQRSVGYLTEGANKPHVIRSYTDDANVPLHLSISKYFGDTYISIAHGDKVEVLQGDLPKSDTTRALALTTLVSMSVTGGAQYLSAKTEGRFIIAQQGASYVVYDLELKKTTTTALKGSAAVASELRWIDGYTLWSDQDSRLRLYEFDGANQQDIMQVEPGFSASISPNSKYLYGITKTSDGQYHLTRVRLIL
ncbi:MAG TPA: PEGA domain-containing protein [Candidatus Saccharimonadales bacterium]|nr:PEGA domain-containing protein [Candidatus Saccharimonadales bacterium]